MTALSWPALHLLRSCRHAIRTVRASVLIIIVKLYLRSKGVTYGKTLTISSLPLVSRHEQSTIELGTNVTISNRLEENLAGIVHRTVLATSEPGAQLKIGNHVGMSGVVIYCANDITIEDWVNLGVNVKIYDTDFHPTGAADRRVHDKNRITTLPVRLCEDVWVGADATILKGVTVGKRSIIAAGAVVVADVPADCIAAGVPAKVVKRLAPKL